MQMEPLTGRDKNLQASINPYPFAYTLGAMCHNRGPWNLAICHTAIPEHISSPWADSPPNCLFTAQSSSSPIFFSLSIMCLASVRGAHAVCLPWDLTNYTQSPWPSIVLMSGLVHLQSGSICQMSSGQAEKQPSVIKGGGRLLGGFFSSYQFHFY